MLDEIYVHKVTLDPDEPTDFIDAYLCEIARCQDDGKSTFEDLFVARSETTETTLQWALLYMINYPNVQTKVRAEIHAVIRRGRFPTMADRKQMPYMEATLMEVQRCGDVVPLGVPHAATRNTTLAGYVIPKGTTVTTVFSSLYSDANIWKNPKVFNLSRFLDSDGNVVKSENLLQFSADRKVSNPKPLRAAMWYSVLFTNVAAVAVFGLVLLLFFLRSTSRPAHQPPGPTPWPLIGNFLSLRGDLFTALHKLRSQYGDIYLLYMGSTPAVFVHGRENLQEVLVTRGDEFADRPKLLFSEILSKGKGVASASGQPWKEQRRFALHTLRDFGFGKMSSEVRVIEEIKILLRCLTATKGSTFSIGKLFHTSVGNVINSLVFGDRFQHDDPKMVTCTRSIEETLDKIGGSGAVNFVPWLKYLPGDFFGFKNIMKNKDLVESFLIDQIQQHKETLNPDEPRDFIDAYLSEMYKAQEKDPHTTFEDEQLLKVIEDLFVAGTETTATTLQWALVYMINYPDVQTKVRAEIRSVIGRGRFPTMADRKHMPYMEATLMEVLRCGDISPLSVPHAASQDTSLAGYAIPKGTIIMTPLISLHKDPQVWKDPEVFDPCRFLDSDGNIVKSDNLLPFSAGKRVCLGESLARMELFLYLSSMLQRFIFKAPEGVTSLSEKAIIGLTRRPPKYSLRAVTAS
ncbi:cytochrome P450 2J4-like [Liolophura sinensis]|uniref:cytochrome P450 2J4-like n=1 Tax=Liolophura sinensis TaxID=3198878 RepID=UPI003157F236